jgi:hypothetical protein
MEWLKVQTLSSNPITAKKKKKEQSTNGKWEGIKKWLRRENMVDVFCVHI